MQGFRAKCRVGALVVLFLCVGLAALYGLLKSVPNECVMTSMNPTYIPISTPANVSSEKYGLFLYHEGWQKIDFAEHIKKLNGVPVLFIPGNGGSYKQVRSLAAESFRAYQGGPLEPTFYQEASASQVDDFVLPSQYTNMLDWFSVDLEGEHSAMDGQILEEHTEYVVCAIHRILDQYRESHEARSKEGAAVPGNLPTSVILVGHSMGGFVARAAAVHPLLRMSAVETILTLASPHQSPPVALQPSLGHFFSKVNEEWKKGYEMQITHVGHFVSSPKLSNAVAVSVSGGVDGYQVRSKLASLDGIVPPTHGFMIGSSGMKNVWISMGHQAILWCNQLIVQISHTLLSMINPQTGRPFSSAQERLLVFTKMLQSGIPQSLNWLRHEQPSWASRDVPIKDTGSATASVRSHAQRKEFHDDKIKSNPSLLSKMKSSDAFDPLGSDSTKTFSDSQLEIFNYRHGVLILHFLAMLMFMPSLVACLQRIGMEQRFHWFIDAALCVGVILHGLYGSRPEDIDSLSLFIPGTRGHEVALSVVYLLAGYYSFLGALASVPYRALFYAIAAIGAVFFTSRIIDRRNREKGDVNLRNSRRHFRRH